MNKDKETPSVTQPTLAVKHKMGSLGQVQSSFMKSAPTEKRSRLHEDQVIIKKSRDKLVGKSNPPSEDTFVEVWPEKLRNTSPAPSQSTILMDEELCWKSWQKDENTPGIIAYVYNEKSKPIAYTLPCESPLVDGKSEIVLLGSFNCFIFDDGVIRCIFTDKNALRKAAFGTFTIRDEEDALRPWTLSETLSMWNECNNWADASLFRSEEFYTIHTLLTSIVIREKERLQGGFWCDTRAFMLERRYLELHHRRSEPIVYFRKPDRHQDHWENIAKIGGLRYDSRKGSITLCITYKGGSGTVYQHIPDHPKLWMFMQEWHSAC